MTNVDAYVQGDTDQWSPDTYKANASFVYSDSFTNPVINLLQFKGDERILDLGCGNGQLTLKLASKVPKGHVLGADSSPSMISEANRTAQGPNVQYQVVDGHETAYLGESQFDAVFSNAALHWMKRDPQDVIDGVYHVLKPGGRFVGEFGGFMNLIGVVSMIEETLQEQGMSEGDIRQRHPWFFPSDVKYKTMLEKVGFSVESIQLIPRITPLNEKGLVGWLDTFAFSYFAGMSDAEVASIKESIANKLKVDMCEDGQWKIMYVRLRFVATK